MDFLEADFDPGKLTIAQLKSLLSQHTNVQLPMKAEKKQFYLDLFRDHITAKTKVIRRQIESVKPTISGITAVSKRGSPLPSHQANMDAVHVQIPVKTPARGRKRLEENSRTFSGTAPSFDPDNVFQSGGGYGKSTVDDNRGPSTEKKRRSRASSKRSSPIKSSPAARSSSRSVSPKRSRSRSQRTGRTRRVTRKLNFAAGETPNDDQLLPPPSSVMTQPPAEDFLVANSSAVLQTPTVRSSSKTPVKFAFKPPPIAGYVDPRELMAAAKRQQERLDQPTIISRGLRVLGFSVRFALAAAVLYLLFYLQEWRTLQYCSSNNRAMANKDLFTVLGVPFPLPECRPCPPHAICQGSEIERCSSGYIVYHPIFPFHPKCEPDVVKYANIELLASTLAQYLSDHAGAVECGEIAGNTYQEESAVKQTMAARFPQWDRLRFNDYWQVLIDELASTPSLGKSGGVPTSIIQVRKK